MGLLNEIKELTLSENTIKNIIIEYVEKDTGRKVKDVFFNTVQANVGYGYGEHTACVLKDITIKFE